MDGVRGLLRLVAGVDVVAAVISDDHAAVAADTRTDALGTTLWMQCQCGWFIEHVITELDLLNMWRSHIVVATLESEVGSEAAGGALGTGPARMERRGVLRLVSGLRRPGAGWPPPPPPAPRHLAERPHLGVE